MLRCKRRLQIPREPIHIASFGLPTNKGKLFLITSKKRSFFIKKEENTGLFKIEETSNFLEKLRNWLKK